jgi:RNA polymerase sigma factor (sigma-70 family)
MQQVNGIIEGDESMGLSERTHSATDNQLMLKVRDGEIEKLGVLFQKYRKLLLHFFVGFTRNHALSEDLVQDVFLRMLKYRHTFGPESQFTAWMYQIARNVQFRHFRKHEREVLLDEDEYKEKVAGEDPTPDEKMEQHQDIDFLHQALAQLPDHKREVLIMSRFQNLKYKEIAARMRCDEGTIKVRAFRALREVEEAFFELAGEGRRRTRCAAHAYA